LHGITLDNASNNDTFAKELSRKLKEEEGVDWDYQKLRFRCFDHILNLAAQSALDIVKDDIGKVGHFHSFECIPSMNDMMLYNSINVILQCFLQKDTRFALCYSYIASTFGTP
jgi:hypothetical protein